MRIKAIGTVIDCRLVSVFRKAPRLVFQNIIVNGLKTVLRITRRTDKDRSPENMWDKYVEAVAPEQIIYHFRFNKYLTYFTTD